MRLEPLRQDLAALAGREAVVYGSAARGEATARSDVDIAVLTRSFDRAHNQGTWWTLLGKAPERYDVRVFELLPIHIQADIAREHVVVFGDAAAIGEYFTGFRRRWRDVRHRYEEPLPVWERVARRQAWTSQ